MWDGGRQSVWGLGRLCFGGFNAHIKRGEIIMDFLKDHWKDILLVAWVVGEGAGIIAKMTPSPADDKAVSKFKKGLRTICMFLGQKLPTVMQNPK